MAAKFASAFMINTISKFIIFQGCCGWLWWNPASEMDTYNKCKEMKEKDDMWYPTYCDDLIYKHEENQPNKVQTYSGSLSNPGTTRSPDSKSRLPEDIIGWGWSEWGEWGDGGCPDICGRRCNRRARYCHGPYNLICKGRGIVLYWILPSHSCITKYEMLSIRLFHFLNSHFDHFKVQFKIMMIAKSWKVMIKVVVLKDLQPSQTRLSCNSRLEMRPASFQIMRTPCKTCLGWIRLCNSSRVYWENVWGQKEIVLRKRG